MFKRKVKPMYMKPMRLDSTNADELRRKFVYENMTEEGREKRLVKDLLERNIQISERTLWIGIAMNTLVAILLTVSIVLQLGFGFDWW